MLAQDINGFVDFGVGHFGVWLFDVFTSQLTDGDFRVNLESGSKLEVFCIALCRFETRVASYAQFLLDSGFIEALLNLLAQHFFAHLCAIVGLNDFGRCFTRAETLNFGSAGNALQALGYLCVDCCQRQCNAHATLEAAQRFQLYLHVQSLDSKGVGWKPEAGKPNGLSRNARGTMLSLLSCAMNFVLLTSEFTCKTGKSRRLKQGASIACSVKLNSARCRRPVLPASPRSRTRGPALQNSHLSAACQ